jgi:hypothetical protein
MCYFLELIAYILCFVFTLKLSICIGLDREGVCSNLPKSSLSTIVYVLWSSLFMLSVSTINRVTVLYWKHQQVIPCFDLAWRFRATVLYHLEFDLRDYMRMSMHGSHDPGLSLS